MSENERDIPDTEDKPADIKLYKRNDPVNFRLTKANEDILHLLNEKKLQGVVISEYLCALIRTAEGLDRRVPGMPRSTFQNDAGGLETPSAAFSQPQEQQSNAVVMLHPDQMSQLVAQITAQLLSGGFVPAAKENSESGIPQEDVETQRKKDELKKLAEDLLDWD